MTVISSLEDIRNLDRPADNTSGAEAGYLLQYFTTKRFLYTAFIFRKLLRIVQPANLLEKSIDFDILSAVTLIEEAMTDNSEMPSEEKLEDLIQDAENFAEENDIEFEAFTQPRLRKNKKFPGEKAEDSSIVDPMLKLRIETYYAPIDSLNTQFMDRFGKENDKVLSIYERPLLADS